MQQSDRLILHRPQPGDFERYYEIHSDPETNLFNPSGPMNLEKAKATFAEMITHWDEHGFGSWTIKTKDTGTIIGFGGLSYRMYVDELKLNLGYRFDKNFWGKGYATELSIYAIHFGFTELQVEQIFAVVRPKHEVSIKVLEKCKMELFGKLDDVPDEENSLVFNIKK